jgi:hypothetical protein
MTIDCCLINGNFTTVSRRFDSACRSMPRIQGEQDAAPALEILWPAGGGSDFFMHLLRAGRLKHLPQSAGCPSGR